jgi:hypothetical protein
MTKFVYSTNITMRLQIQIVDYFFVFFSLFPLGHFYFQQKIVLHEYKGILTILVQYLLALVERP